MSKYYILFVRNQHALQGLPDLYKLIGRKLNAIEVNFFQVKNQKESGLII